MPDWRVGDRVRLSPTGRTEDRVRGTVLSVNPPGLPAGVKVKLDRPIRGCHDCYASHSELERLYGTGGPNSTEVGAEGGVADHAE